MTIAVLTHFCRKVGRMHSYGLAGLIAMALLAPASASAQDIEAQSVGFKTTSDVSTMALEQGGSYRFHARFRFSGLSRRHSWKGSWYVNGQLVRETTFDNSAGLGYASGASVETTITSPTYTAPSPGTYTLTFTLDRENRVAEINETNNSVSRQFTVVQALPPGASTAVSPVGNIGDNRSPVFRWTTASGATWYHVIVYRLGERYLSRWTQNTSWTAPTALQGGDYAWRVQSYGPGGYGPWSSEANFSINVNLPGKPIGGAPIGEQPAGQRRPGFFWTAGVPVGQWNQIMLHRNGRAYLTQWVEGITEWTPPNDLPSGDYDWWVRGWNADGFGLWSDGTNFTIPLRVPGTITQLAPSGAQASHDLTYRWQQDANATWYRLWVGRAGTGTWHDRWHNFTGAGEAAVEVANHPAGTFTWWLRPWGPDGFGPWSGPGAFTTPSQEPTVPVLVVPLGETVENPPVFAWESERAEWFRIYVQRVGGPAVVDQWTAEPTLTPAVALPAGQYAWWVGAWNRVTGRMVWSQRGDFSTLNGGYGSGGP